MLEKVLVFVFLGGFVLLGALLLTNHPGIAIKTANYVYLFLIVVFLFKTVRNVKQN